VATLLSAPLRQQALSALFPVLAGRADALVGRLRALAAAVRERLPLASSLHFARFVLLPAADEAEGQGHASLLFATTFDGELEAHLGELWHAVGAELAEIFCYCEGWRSPGGRAELSRFVRRHLRPAAALFSAPGGLTVPEVKAAARLRADIARVLDERALELHALEPLAIVERVRAVLAASGSDAGWTGPLAQVERGRLLAPASPARILLRRGPALALAWLRSLVLDVSDALRALWQAEPRSAWAPSDARAPATAPGSERCFSHVARLKPGKTRRTALRLALSLLDELAALATRGGGLAGTECLHGARWLLVQDGRLVLLGDFDGSPYASLGALSAGAGSALSMLWSHTERFPPTLGWRLGGARDEVRFRRFARDGSLEAPLWYSAYPELGGREVQQNAEIQRLWRSELDPGSAERLLALIED